MRRAIVILLCLLVPVASGAGHTIADLRIEHRLPVEALHAVDLADASPETMGEDVTTCEEALGSLPFPEQVGTRPSEHFSTPSLSGHAMLVFHEDQYEHGCAEARYVLDVPPEADQMHVGFLADRNVDSNPDALDVVARQEVRFYAIRDDEAVEDVRRAPMTCWGPDEVFPKEQPTVSRPVPYGRDLDLADCSDELLGQRVVLAFMFADASEMRAAYPSGAQVNAVFQARVIDPVVSFTGQQLVMTQRFHDDLDPSGQAFGYLAMSVDVPPLAPGQRGEVAFAISNDHGILGFYKDGSDGGITLDDTEIQAEELGGLLRFTISADVIEERGAGGYTVLFTSPETGQVSAGRIPLVALALLAPLVVGIVAQRNVSQLHRTARGDRPVMRGSLQSALVGAWALFIIVVLGLFLTDTGIGMTAWPMPPATLLAYVTLLAVVGVMAAIAVLAKRHHLQMVMRERDELQSTKQELERSNRELEQFAYVASHDLKEPLRMVAGYTDLLESRYSDRLDKDGMEFIAYAHQGAHRMQRMVDDLLQYSRVRRDHQRVHDVRLADVVGVVRTHLHRLIEERGVRLTHGPLPTVRGERGQLVQLLLNLVQNAIKFSPGPEPWVKISARVRGPDVVISVRDGGIGIDPRHRERIFGIFQRLHAQDAYQGNGIGLAMCKKIVEQAGGEIWVESGPGKGSTFRFTWPAVPASMPSHRPQDAGHHRPA